MQIGVHAQPCPTLCNPVDCSPPDSSFCEILQARILEWVAISWEAPERRLLPYFYLAAGIGKLAHACFVIFYSSCFF